MNWIACLSTSRPPCTWRSIARFTSISSATSALPIQRMQCARRAGPSRTCPSVCPCPRGPSMLSAGTMQFSSIISQWFPLPAMVSISRTILKPGFGSSTINAELRACGGSASGSVFAITIANFAPCAPEINHLCPLITQLSPCFTAAVLICVGSEPAASGSVIAKHDLILPSHSGRKYFSFCAGVAKCSNVCMLPSSGACTLRMNDARRVRPHSAEITAIAIASRPSPPNSAGICGSHRPRCRALRRNSIIPSRQLPFFCIAASAGSISSLINARTLSRISSTCGGIVKSIDIRFYLGAWTRDYAQVLPGKGFGRQPDFRTGAAIRNCAIREGRDQGSNRAMAGLGRQRNRASRFARRRARDSCRVGGSGVGRRL